MVLVLVRLHLVPFRVVALHRRGAVAGGMQAAWGGGLRELGSAAAISRVPVGRKAAKALHRGATGASEDSRSRVSEAGNEQTVIYSRPRYREAETARLYSIVEQVGNHAEVHETSRFTMF